MRGHYQYQLIRFLLCSAVLALVLPLTSCVTGPTEQRIDNIPMYGQPNILRPDVLKKADEDFIRQASSGFGGSRETASRAWYAEAEQFMNRGDLDYAMRRYNQSWLLNPNSYLPYWGFARVMLQRGKMDEAIEYFEKSIKLCDDSFQKVALISDAGAAYSHKAASIPASQPEEKARYFYLANQNFMKSTKLDSSYWNAWAQWAHSLYREGKYSESWEKLKKARSLGARGIEDFIESLSKKMPEPK